MWYTHSKRIRVTLKGMVIAAAVVCLLTLPKKACAQEALELAGGWSHITGNQGTDGFNFGAGWNFTNKVMIAADYDTTWDNSRIGTFEVTQTGAVTSKSHYQHWMFGPRIFFSTAEIRNRRIEPFGEVQFGVSRLATTLASPGFPDIHTTDSAFSWMLGGGADYVFSTHWAARGKLDFLRTHFADIGQSRLRLGIGVTYTFGSREK